MSDRTPPFTADDTTWAARINRTRSPKSVLIAVILLAASWVLGMMQTNGHPLDTAADIAATSVRFVFCFTGLVVVFTDIIRSYVPRRVRNTSKAFAGSPDINEQVRDFIHRYDVAMNRAGYHQPGERHLGLGQLILTQERLAIAQQRLAAHPGDRAQRRYEKARGLAADVYAAGLERLTNLETAAAAAEQAKLDETTRNGG